MALSEHFWKNNASCRYFFTLARVNEHNQYQDNIEEQNNLSSMCAQKVNMEEQCAEHIFLCKKKKSADRMNRGDHG